MDEAPGSLQVDQVVVGEFLSLQLPGGRQTVARPTSPLVEGGLLVWVFAVAELGNSFEVQEQSVGKPSSRRQLQRFSLRPDGGQELGDLPIVLAGMDEGLPGEREQASSRQSAVALPELIKNVLVVVRAGHDNDIGEVLGGGANHGGSADVDVLDDFFECCVLPKCRFDERVEVDTYQIDRLNGVSLEGLHVLGVAANG